MNRKQLAEILKYSSPKEILVVTWDNRLITLKCPFKVRVIEVVAFLELRQILTVDEVKITKDLKTVFIIHNQAFYYNYFEFLLNNE